MISRLAMPPLIISAFDEALASPDGAPSRTSFSLLVTTD